MLDFDYKNRSEDYVYGKRVKRYLPKVKHYLGTYYLQSKYTSTNLVDDVMPWTHFPRYWAEM